jgi:hypothetical protein
LKSRLGCTDHHFCQASPLATQMQGKLWILICTCCAVQRAPMQHTGCLQRSMAYQNKAQRTRVAPDKRPPDRGDLLPSQALSHTSRTTSHHAYAWPAMSCQVMLSTGNQCPLKADETSVQGQYM